MWQFWEHVDVVFDFILASSARTHARSEPYVYYVLQTRAMIAGSIDGRKIKIDLNHVIRECKPLTYCPFRARRLEFLSLEHCQRSAADGREQKSCSIWTKLLGKGFSWRVEKLRLPESR